MLIPSHLCLPFFLTPQKRQVQTRLRNLWCSYSMSLIYSQHILVRHCYIIFSISPKHEKLLLWSWALLLELTLLKASKSVSKVGLVIDMCIYPYPKASQHSGRYVDKVSLSTLTTDLTLVLPASKSSVVTGTL